MSAQLLRAKRMLFDRSIQDRSGALLCNYDYIRATALLSFVVCIFYKHFALRFWFYNNELKKKKPAQPLVLTLIFAKSLKIAALKQSIQKQRTSHETGRAGITAISAKGTSILALALANISFTDHHCNVMINWSKGGSALKFKLTSLIKVGYFFCTFLWRKQMWWNEVQLCQKHGLHS